MATFLPILAEAGTMAEGWIAAIAVGIAEQLRGSGEG